MKKFKAASKDLEMVENSMDNMGRLIYPAPESDDSGAG